VSNRHLTAIRSLAPNAHPGGPPTRALLFVLSDCACEICGLAWPGMKLLETLTLLGHTRLRQSVRELVNSGLVVIHAYPTGGRGRTTEYIVLPHMENLAQAPCVECRKRMGRPSTNGNTPHA